MVLVPEDAARSLLLLPPGRATDIAVQSARDEENDALVPEIASALDEPVRVVTRAQMLGAYRVQSGRTGTLAFAMLAPAILGLLLLVAATASGGASARADVGKLKMIGWSSGEVARLHVLEVGIVGIVAVGLALSAAYAGLFVFGGASVASTVLGWKTEAPFLLLSTEGAALSLLVIGAAVLVPCLVAAVVPAVRLARTDPVELTEAP
jgi:ABC-type lipoprotein release transport system permease subunit